MPIPLIYCLLFGALISPTDPIAVLAILKEAKIPASLEIKISGESLFNDGVAVVVFVTLLDAARSVISAVDILSVGKLFLQEAIGGLVFGAVIGYLGFYALKSIDDYKVEVLVTLAIVVGGYSLAGHLHLSGPLAMVVAGIITGNKARDGMLSQVSRDYLGKFWELVDEILNAILFLLIGLEMLVIKINVTVLMIGTVSVILVLVARWTSVFFPIMLLRFKLKFERHAVAILTWGGLRGGLSVELAHSLSPDMHRDEFVLITYMIVVFSILVQGLTIGPLSKHLNVWIADISGSPSTSILVRYIHLLLLCSQIGDSDEPEHLNPGQAQINHQIGNNYTINLFLPYALNRWWDGNFTITGFYQDFK